MKKTATKKPMMATKTMAKKPMANKSMSMKKGKCS
jgi:hypothetical protein